MNSFKIVNTNYGRSEVIKRNNVVVEENHDMDAGSDGDKP
jgi:hypothetical protein